GADRGREPVAEDRRSERIREHIRPRLRAALAVRGAQLEAREPSITVLTLANRLPGEAGLREPAELLIHAEGRRASVAQRGGRRQLMPQAGLRLSEERRQPNARGIDVRRLNERRVRQHVRLWRREYEAFGRRRIELLDVLVVAESERPIEA